MTANNAFVDETVDRLQLVGPVIAKRMFGGHGLFLDGRMFALIADNELYLKADSHSSHHFDEQGLPRFTYTKSGGKTYHMSYFLAPETFYEEDDETRLWAERAIQAAARAPRKQHKKARR